MKRIILSFLIICLSNFSIHAQDTTKQKAKTQTITPNLIRPPVGGGGGIISGPTTVNWGQTSNYSFPYAYPNITWSVSNGAVSNYTRTGATVVWSGGFLEVYNKNINSSNNVIALGGPNVSISPKDFFNYSPESTTTGTVSVYSNGTLEASLLVGITIPPLVGGEISPSNQTNAYNTVPAPLTYSGASGGKGSYDYSYQWQVSSNGTTWSNISGITGVNYTPTASQNNSYYRVAVSEPGQSSTYSSNASIIVPVQPLSITPSSKAVTYNSSPGILTCGNPVGGNVTHTYQWQSSYDELTWNNISAATSLSYTPGNLTKPTFFRLAIDNSAFSNITEISITGAPINNPPTPGDYTMPGVATVDSTHANRSDVVGAITGNASVSLTGGATYTIPVNIPAGTNGMQPSVDINYSSLSGDGVAGWGWSLNASSVITRAGKNNYYNGITTPVNFTNSNDAFILDGQRLMVVSGNNGADGTIYGTENESFSKIQSFGGSETSGPDYFIVTTKDGKTMEFGHASSSKMNTDDGQSTMMWFLNKVTDQNGNYIQYKYFINPTDRDFQLTEIDYTGNTNTGLQPYNKVLFTYTVRQNWEDSKKYISGASLVSPFNLSNITVQDQNGTTVRGYNFNYNLVNNLYYLASVSETGSDGKSLTPTVFTYGNDSNIPDIQNSGLTSIIPESVDISVGDYNGDGRADFLIDSFKYDNKGIKLHTSLEVISDISIDGNASACRILMQRSFVPESYTIIKNTAFSTNSYRLSSSDFTGDGSDDIVEVNTTLYNPGGNYKPIQSVQTIKLFSIHRTINDGVKVDSTLLPAAPTDFLNNQSFSYIPDGKEFFLPGDFDGDGTTDYILILGRLNIPGQPSSGIYYKAFFTSPSKNIINQEIFGFNLEGNTNTNTYTATSIATADQISPIQLNGSSKTAIMVTKGDSSYLLCINALPGSVGLGNSYSATIMAKTAVIGKDNVYYTGDFNGDGNADLLVRAKDGISNGNAAWSILYGTGAASGFPFSSPVSFAFPTYVQLPGDYDRHSAYTIPKILLGDFNGDGKTDIGCGYYNSSNLTGKFAYAQITGSHFTYSFYEAPNFDPFSSLTNVSDFDGDGRSDLFCFSSPGQNSFYYFKPFSTATLLANVQDGFGKISSFQYTSLAGDYHQWVKPTYYQLPAYSSSDPTMNYPFNVIKPPVFVASSISLSNGIGGMSTVDYSYDGLVFHRAGKGFLGFKSVIIKNETSGVTTKIDNNINIQYAVPYQTKQTTTLTATSDQLSEQDISTSFVSKSTNGYFDMRYLPQVDQTVNVNYLTGAASESDNTYDGYGNITGNVVKSGGWSGSSVNTIETTSTTATYGVHNTPVAAMPDNVTLQKVRSGQPAVSSETAFTYDSKGNIATKIDFADKPLPVTKTSVYDHYGNTTQITVSASGVTNKVSNNTYDALGRFILKKEQLGGSVTKTQSYTYDSWGNPLTSTSTDGLISTFSYDGFGRLVKTVLPDGQIQAQSLSWASGGNALYIDYTYAPKGGSSPVKTAYDLLGRSIASQTNGFNNQILSSNKTYDAKGNLVSQTAPYYPNEAPQVTTTQYDAYNRVTRITTPVTFMSTAYTKLSGGQSQVTATNAAGQSSSKTQDGSGKVVTANDNGGALNYSYNSRGNVISTSIGSTVLITNAYDDYGRQISLTDKNAGTITYQYNALGQLTQQKDALNHIYSMVYDDFGRLTTKTGPEGSTSYTYYSNADYNNDNPVTIVGPSGDITTFAYDNLGRKVSQTTVIDGSSYTDQYQYNSLSQLTKTTYASGIIINDVYDENGIPIQTSLQDNGNSTTLFTATAMNSRGVYTNYTLGNGKTSQVDFDLSLGVPTRYYTPGIQDLNMTWDAQKGNLNARKDAINNLNETFTYDNLNRLTGSSINTVQQLSMAYDNTNGSSLGNIATKSDAGNYVYKTDKINAVAYITNPAGASTPPSVISSQTQQIGYTPFLKVDSIAQNGYVLRYTYDAEQQRIKSVLQQNGNIIETKYYFGDYEKQIKGDTTRFIHYIAAGNGLAAIAVKENGITKIYYVYSDHLGSILTLTDGTGNVVIKQNFDAWGRNRNPDDWTYANVPTTPTWLYRGYTGHEHLANFALINMNGRVYDPVQGRMLSPDNYVQEPWNTQSYNRYSYCINNPLLYNDRTGELFGVDDLIVSAIGFTYGYISSGIKTHNWGWKSLGAGLLGAAEFEVGYLTFGGGLTASGINSSFISVLNATGYSALSVASGVEANFVPSLNLPISNNFSLSISPTVGFGSSGITLGGSLSVAGQIGSLALSASVGAGYNSGASNFGDDIGGSSYANVGGFAGYNDGHANYGAGYSYNNFGGKTAQGVGAFQLQAGDFGFRFDEDLYGDGGDRYRTGGGLFTYRVNDDLTLALGGSMMTGNAIKGGANPTNPIGPNGTWRAEDMQIREGTLYGGPVYKGQAYFLGNNSEKRLHSIQNFIHRNLTTTPYFQNLGFSSSTYSYQGSFNSQYLFY